LEDIGLPDAMRAALPEAVETLVRAEVADDADLAGEFVAPVEDRRKGEVDEEFRGVFHLRQHGLDADRFVLDLAVGSVHGRRLFGSE